MRQKWVFVLLLAVVLGLSWRTGKHRSPSGTTTIEVSLGKSLAASGVTLRLRSGQRIVELAGGHQELETIAGENDLVLVCPRALVGTHLFARPVADRHDSFTLAIACRGALKAITCEMTIGDVTTPLGMAFCSR